MVRVPFSGRKVRHVNCLTGSIKKGNRKSEILLRDVEVGTMYCILASAEAKKSAAHRNIGIFEPQRQV